jgi:hypothetical protein
MQYTSPDIDFNTTEKETILLEQKQEGYWTAIEDQEQPPFGPSECSAMTSLSFMRSSMFMAHSYLFITVKEKFQLWPENIKEREYVIRH